MTDETPFSILPDVPLKPHTTFKIGGPARFWAEVRTSKDVRAAMAFAATEGLSVLVLGGGSNVLISDRGFDGLVLHPAMTGAEWGDSGDDHVSVRVAAGEVWDATVAASVERGLWGIENLSHIPGQTGAALVQNIGAYGQQLSDVLVAAEVLDLATGETESLAAADCGLGYRGSIFNTTRRRAYCILSLELRLSRQPHPNLAYRDLREHFAGHEWSAPSQAEIRQAVIAIRDRKFPFPREERGGNAGSFFKNPTVDAGAFAALASRVRSRFGPNACDRLDEIGRRAGTGEAVKVPAAFLIDIAGLKGAESGGAQVNPSQPLVILNRGGATAEDVLRLAGQVRATVFGETGIGLQPEPELIGFNPAEVRAFLGPQ